ncbi:MAG: prepilin-type N-terminal cleavage/methylation domain-containing protein [bacterium]|nr:prepilin-type N-terminal cleavage/methylation domain-containing protein [bacterium]
MKNKGFTLIEVLVSTLILAIGVFAMVRLFPTASMVNARADRISQATILAEDKIEQIRSMGYDSLQTLISAGQDKGTYKVETITLNWNLSTVDNLIQVKIVCSWPPPGRIIKNETSIKLVTLVSDHE